jgi:hypothetical protein
MTATGCNADGTCAYAAVDCGTAAGACPILSCDPRPSSSGGVTHYGNACVVVTADDPATPMNELACGTCPGDMCGHCIGNHCVVEERQIVGDITSVGYVGTDGSRVVVGDIGGYYPDRYDNLPAGTAVTSSDCTLVSVAGGSTTRCVWGAIEAVGSR